VRCAISAGDAPPDTAHLPLAEGTDDLARLTPEALAHTIPSTVVGEGQGGGSVFSFVRTRAIPLQLTAVSALIALAAIIRFRGLPGTGPVAYDEGWAPANGHLLAAEADSLAALSVLLYLLDHWWDRRPSVRLMALSLLAFVATLTLNYRLAPVLLALALVAGYLGLRSRGRFHHLRPSSAWLITLCLVPALAMTAAYLLVLVADVFHVHVPAAVHHLLRSGGTPVPFAFPDFYPRTLWQFAGPV